MAYERNGNGTWKISCICADCRSEWTYEGMPTGKIHLNGSTDHGVRPTSFVPRKRCPDCETPQARRQRSSKEANQELKKQKTDLISEARRAYFNSFNGQTLHMELPSVAHPDVLAKRYDPGLYLRLPENECKHGRLPGDRTQPCGCFEEEMET